MINEDKNLSKSAKVVQEALLKKGFSFEVVELPSSTRTAKDAANTLGCEVAQIIKSLLFRSEKTNQPILILASGINRVNEIMIEKIVGEKIVKADAGFTRDVTGFAIGGVPPVGHKQTINYIFVDEDLLKFDQLWAAAGTPNAVFSLRSNDLLNLTDGKIVAIK
ncbi:MAG: YbaK/EbsC family protein [Gammaproteobacteria bacterium]|nr:YbaK/EbsC family protein [Gammaproteobacteria bacterium]MCW5584407.1 YbaK/EbsC family protein [Gammaproteobacteria bacterium]